MNYNLDRALVFEDFLSHDARRPSHMPMTANGLAKLIEEIGELTVEASEKLRASDPADAAGLVELLARLGRMSQVAAKRLAYHRGPHPDGQGDLDVRLQNEMADVAAAMAFVRQQFRLDIGAIDERARRKLHQFREWHDDPTNDAEAFDVPPPRQESVALREVGLTRDVDGVCIVTVNGREAIRDNGDVISHYATLDWFSGETQ